VAKISAQSEHFSVLVLKVSHSKFGFLNFFVFFLIRNPDSEYGSGSRAKSNADPTGSGSETLARTKKNARTEECIIRGIYGFKKFSRRKRSLIPF
jgi:hypothetical protein